LTQPLASYIALVYIQRSYFLECDNMKLLISSLIVQFNRFCFWPGLCPGVWHRLGLGGAEAQQLGPWAGVWDHLILMIHLTFQPAASYLSVTYIYTYILYITNLACHKYFVHLLSPN
jgi:hypothetical protein